MLDNGITAARSSNLRLPEKRSPDVTKVSNTGKALDFVNGFRPAGADVLHHVRIRADRCERMQIVRRELADLETRCLNLVHTVNRTSSGFDTAIHGKGSLSPVNLRAEK